MVAAAKWRTFLQDDVDFTLKRLSHICGDMLIRFKTLLSQIFGSLPRALISEVLDVDLM